MTKKKIFERIRELLCIKEKSWEIGYRTPLGMAVLPTLFVGNEPLKRGGPLKKWGCNPFPKKEVPLFFLLFFAAPSLGTVRRSY